MSVLAAIGFLVIGGMVSAIVLIVGVMVAVGAVLTLWSALSPTTRTTGEVVEVSKRRTVRGTRVRVAYYTPDGRFETGAYVQRPQLGGQIPVWFNPRKPGRATTTTSAQLWRQLAVIIPVVAVFAMLAAGLILSSVWYFSGSHAQLQAPVGGGSLFFTCALVCGFGAVLQYRAIWKWRRMVRTDGKILQHVDAPKPGTAKVSGIRVTFQTGEGEEEEFWAQANVPGSEGDSVAVYYDPDKPVATATVETAKDHRQTAFISTTFALVFAAFAVFILAV